MRRPCSQKFGEIFHEKGKYMWWCNNVIIKLIQLFNSLRFVASFKCVTPITTTQSHNTCMSIMLCTWDSCNKLIKQNRLGTAHCFESVGWSKLLLESYLVESLFFHRNKWGWIMLWIIVYNASWNDNIQCFQMFNKLIK